MIHTQDRILDTAERLFGDQGYAGTSLRQIIAEAGVNLAAIHYHFGTKEDLLDQLVKRKVGPVNAQRLALLDRYEIEAGSAPVPVEKLLEAFLEPPLNALKEHPEFVKLMGRLYGEGLVAQFAEKHFQTIVTRFMAAFTRAFPNLSQPELALRLQFVVGAMAHTMLFACQTRLPGRPYPVDGPVLLRELTAFAAAGLNLPALRENTEETQ